MDFTMTNSTVEPFDPFHKCDRMESRGLQSCREGVEPMLFTLGQSHAACFTLKSSLAQMTWSELGEHVTDRGALARLIANWGLDPDSRYGLELARSVGDARLIRTAVLQILEDWDNGDPCVGPFLSSRPLDPGVTSAA